MIWLLSKLGLIRGVYLLDCWGDTYSSIAYYRTNKRAVKLFGETLKKELWCRVYPFTAVGDVVLNPDSTTSGDSSYIKKWRYI